MPNSINWSIHFSFRHPQTCSSNFVPFMALTKSFTTRQQSVYICISVHLPLYKKLRTKFPLIALGTEGLLFTTISQSEPKIWPQHTQNAVLIINVHVSWTLSPILTKPAPSQGSCHNIIYSNIWKIPQYLCKHHAIGVWGKGRSF